MWKRVSYELRASVENSYSLAISAFRYAARTQNAKLCCNKLHSLIIFYLVQLGAAHGDDLTYEFYSEVLKNMPQPDSPAEKMVRVYTTLLTNFAKDGYVWTIIYCLLH